MPVDHVAVEVRRAKQILLIERFSVLFFHRRGGHEKEKKIEKLIAI